MASEGDGTDFHASNRATGSPVFKTSVNLEWKSIAIKYLYIVGDGLQAVSVSVRLYLTRRYELKSGRKKVADKTAHEAVKLVDVANAAGVAIATASRAISNPGRVNAETREKVLQVAQQLGYTMNVAARSLRSGLSHSIMVMLPPWHSSDIFETILHAIDEELVRSGYNMIVGNLGSDRIADPRKLELARGGFVDGLLAIANEPPLRGKLSVLSAQVPTVGLLIDLSRHGIPSVVSDDRNAIYQLARAMLDEGRRRFMYVSGPKDQYHDDERFAGFKKALSGVPDLAKPQRFDGDWSFDAGARAARSVLDKAPAERPDAVIFSNDRMAIAFMDTMTRAGVKVPKDIAIAGFDGIEVAQYCRPSLTTVEQSLELLGAFSARLLLKLIRGEPQDTSGAIVVPTRLIRRESF
jgi:LacI family repressor for deo operon, udp, cdd, tsx, nupC, and nupG